MSIRVYEIANEVEEKLHQMSEQELLGAEDVIQTIYRYLYQTHFIEQNEVNVKAFTKTMEELQEICIQLLDHKFKRSDLFVITEKNK
jgi:hypothetical protein